MNPRRTTILSTLTVFALACDEDYRPPPPDAGRATSPLGGPCTDQYDCTGYMPSCLKRYEKSGWEFAGGYCLHKCGLDFACPDGGTCMFGPGFTGCFLRCTDDSECRVDEGYRCELASGIGTGPPVGFCLPEYPPPMQQGSGEGRVGPTREGGI